MNAVKKDALWWTVVSVIWMVMFIIGYGSKQNSMAIMGLVLTPIAFFNAIKKWIMVRKGWET